MMKQVRRNALLIGLVLLLMLTGCTSPSEVEDRLWVRATVYMADDEVVLLELDETTSVEIQEMLDQVEETERPSYEQTNQQILFVLLVDDAGNKITLVRDMGKAYLLKGQDAFQIDDHDLQTLLDYFTNRATLEMPSSALLNSGLVSINSNLENYKGTFVLTVSQSLDYHSALSMVSWRKVPAITLNQPALFTIATNQNSEFTFYDDGTRGLVRVHESSEEETIYAFPRSILSTLITMVTIDLNLEGVDDVIRDATFISAYVLAGKEEKFSNANPMRYAFTLSTTQSNDVGVLLNRSTWRKLNAIVSQNFYNQLIIDQAGVRYYLINGTDNMDYVRVDDGNTITEYQVESSAIDETMAYIINAYIPLPPGQDLIQSRITKATTTTDEMGTPLETKAYPISASQSEQLHQAMNMSSWKQVVDVGLDFGWGFQYALYTQDGLRIAFNVYLNQTWIVIQDKTDPNNAKITMYFADESIITDVREVLDTIHP